MSVNRELQLTSNVSLAADCGGTLGRRTLASSREINNQVVHPVVSTLPRGGSRRVSYPHNTYSSTTSSFTLPSIIAMPESSAWQDICRWEFCPEHGDDDEEEDFDQTIMAHSDDVVDGRRYMIGDTDADDSTDDAEAEEDASRSSVISQQDRDNKVILLSSSAAGE